MDNAIVMVERPKVSQDELTKLAKLLGKEDLKVSVEGIGVQTKCIFMQEC